MWFSKYGKYLFLGNMSISITSLAFQITVLYPWHEEISKDIRKLTKNIKNLGMSPIPPNPPLPPCPTMMNDMEDNHK